jgi:hypothetical protein
MTLDGIFRFYTTFTLGIPLVALLTSSPTVWSFRISVQSKEKTTPYKILFSVKGIKYNCGTMT